MAKPTTVPVQAFVNEELERLKKQMHAAGMKVTANEAMVGGLILAGVAFPPEALMPFVAEFWRREAEKAEEPSSEPNA